MPPQRAAPPLLAALEPLQARREPPARKGRENFFPGEADSIPWEKLGASGFQTPLRRSADPAGMRATRSAKGAGRNN